MMHEQTFAPEQVFRPTRLEHLRRVFNAEQVLALADFLGAQGWRAENRSREQAAKD